MKLLRTALGPCKILSAAVPHLPWLGTTGRPLTDVSEYAKVLTYVNIMNYDVWGSSANPGPNAPIGDLCKTSKQPQASAQAAFNQWTAAKFPANQLDASDEMVLLQQEEVKNDDDELEVNFLNGAHPNPSITAPPPTPTSASIKDDGEVTAQATLTSWWGQQIPFYEIVRAGALVKRSDGNYGQAGGFTMGWDNCSNTPYLFNTAQTTVVSYDDTWSLTDKAKFAVSSGMAGCFTWSLDQDDGLTLQNAIRKGLGK
ncbi:hypothetical protein NLJ89_g2472 [Agrocybe chaxingu]|uniref:GH18 domain-containing protein n=1 Tax=Agrocybe chaxingu TaxID=84603 RepID=A0A9W8K4C0_9AGAR|nr:hypothetical protein NLJ89_g2472 [Agrocybe chaxingu]